jgi:hypothetical protein
MDPMDAARTAGAILGAVTGALALAWRVVDEFGSFLRIAVKVESASGRWATALTTVENKSYRPKKIHRTFLLVGPNSENPTDTARALLSSIGITVPVNFTNDIGALIPQHPVYELGRAVIPIPFYYSENVDVADETLTYRAAIDLDTFQVGVPYALRFYLFAERQLHRSTHDLFILESPPEATDSLEKKPESL